MRGADGYSESMFTVDLKRGDANEIDQLCLRLFDSWCERRSVIPLAYLMHAWPIPAASPLATIRLQRTLRGLQQFHDDCLTHDDHHVIEQVLAISAHAGNDNPDTILS
ncbi:hypothetical protein [Trinickia mobilis]|uniref:hypothetical protein n=1 Tax=Trinickia mobilis TaxID=2816356 RepID=UPI001A8F2111|nr:hypothetical protein [Trinickia mobilis]